jgi:hypothetical protein
MEIRPKGISDKKAQTGTTISRTLFVILKDYLRNLRMGFSDPATSPGRWRTVRGRSDW